MTDLAVSILSSLHPSGYLESWIFSLLGIVFVATGVSAEVNSDTIPLAGEGLALALSKRLGIRFGNAKITVGVSLVTISLILSFSFSALFLPAFRISFFPFSLFPRFPYPSLSLLATLFRFSPLLPEKQTKIPEGVSVRAKTI